MSDARRSSNGDRSDVERAEEMLEEWGERAGRWLSKAWARTREETEDIWAEAQDLRRRGVTKRS